MMENNSLCLSALSPEQPVGTSTYGPTGAAAGPTETKEVAPPSGTEEETALPFGRVPSGLVVAVAGLLISGAIYFDNSIAPSCQSPEVHSLPSQSHSCPPKSTLAVFQLVLV